MECRFLALKGMNKSKGVGFDQWGLRFMMVAALLARYKILRDMVG